MPKAIISCSCGNVGTYSQTQYKILHPKEPIPTLYVARKAYSFLETLPLKSDAYNFVSAVLKKRGRYSYLIDCNEDGALNEVYDYVKKKRAR